VLRRLAADCGDLTSFGPEELRENHANGPLGLRVGGGGGAGGGFLFTGGAPHGSEGRAPDSPIKPELCGAVSSLGGIGGEFILSLGLGPLSVSSSSLLFIRFTSSSDDAVESRWDVSRGDL
jgi:hypothetical protein